ncbi:Alpha/Beta hydrolase protein [Chaetomium tenue]|uniref:Alpha/Beta hydrolase protein n=1 Tax=Chaetomium tenue TaxID=1854479 RepID=A0ACB7PC50_9PEZI|nr:Alpha/Beta hydrolase protein [Chaetomium globosum]
MHYSTFTTSDNCLLAFQSSIPLPSPSDTSHPTPTTPTPTPTTCILLLHGFSGSSAYFRHNTPALSAPSGHWVIAPDLRGHGRSGHNPAHGGYHVARLAADLHELLTHLRTLLPTNPPLKVVPIGCSIGAAILWTYLELFGDGDAFAGYVFVDQAPLQDRAALGLGGEWGVGLAHAGCYDEATMLAAQRVWVEEPERAYQGLVRECLGYRFEPRPGEGGEEVGGERAARDEAFFGGVSKQVGDRAWLVRLLADHTRYDHREACEGLGRPVLVMAGRRSGCFTLEGMDETVRRARKGGNGDAGMVVFESGHWLFWEEPERFNREVLAFVERCTRDAKLRKHVGRAPFQPDIHLFLALHPHHAQHAGGVCVYPVPAGRAPRYNHQPVPVHNHVMRHCRLALQCCVAKGPLSPAEKRAVNSK